MFDFTRQNSFTLEDVFNSLLSKVEPLLKTIPEDEQGRLTQYIDITKRMQEQVKPENFSMKGFYKLLDEFDDGKSKKDPDNHKHALPLVEKEGDYQFSTIMRDHLQQALDARAKISYKGYSWYVKAAMSIGLINIMPEQIDELSKRCNAYEQKEKNQDQIKDNISPSGVYISWEYECTTSFFTSKLTLNPQLGQSLQPKPLKL